MIDFSHLKDLAVTEETTAEYVFRRIGGNPSIIFAPADDTNESFRRARIKHNLETAKRYAAAPRVKAEELDDDKVIANDEEERETNRGLLARHCAKDWGVAPVDRQGNPVEFSADNCLDFFQQMPWEMFDEAARFASNLFNFYPDVPFKESDGEQLGNS